MTELSSGEFLLVSKRRWLVSLTAVLCAHVFVFWLAFHEVTERHPTTVGTETIMLINFASVEAVTASELENDSPVGPNSIVQTTPQKSTKPEKILEYEGLPEMETERPVQEADMTEPPVETVEITEPQKQEDTIEKVEQAEPERVAEESAPAEFMTAPESVTARLSTETAAPLAGSDVARNTNEMERWQRLVQVHLEHHKRYPKQAQLRRKEGTVYIRFSVDWQGNIHHQKLEKASRIRSLDKESLALLARAEPLPTPPSSADDGLVDLVVPIQFFIQ